MDKKKLISIIIPCYNEENRLQKTLPICISYLKKKDFSWEIIIINDGSTDKTVSVAQRWQKRYHNIKIHNLKDNLGKGAAIRKGVFLSNGEYIIFFDADLSVPIENIEIFLKALKNYDLAIGVRRHPQSKIIRHQPWYREFMGHFFTKLVNLILLRGIYDATCGFKGFRSHIARKIFQKQKINRWAFDAEILFLAQRDNFSLAQIPVSWSDNSDTRVQLFKSTIGAFLDLLKIRYYNFCGKYNFTPHREVSLEQ